MAHGRMAVQIPPAADSLDSFPGLNAVTKRSNENIEFKIGRYGWWFSYYLDDLLMGEFEILRDALLSTVLWNFFFIRLDKQCSLGQRKFV